MYVKNNLKYERHKQYESETDSNICIKVGVPNKRKIYIYGLYRQWSVPIIVNSRTILQQVIRWKKMLTNISDVFDHNVESYLSPSVSVKGLHPDSNNSFFEETFFL